MTGLARTPRMLSRIRIGRRSSEERRERRLRKAQRLAAMRSERARSESNIY
jgi:hypothetical protein